MPGPQRATSSHDDGERLVARPFEGLNAYEMHQKIEDFVKETGIDRNDFPNLQRGAFLAASPSSYCLRRPSDEHALDDNDYVLVNEKEREALGLERTEIKWSTFFTRLRAYPLTVYMVIVCCSLGAIVQGFDESAVNGAQVFYSRAFHINTGSNDDGNTDLGLVNSAPYLISALACLFVNPLNRLFRGRRGVICATCAISAISCLCQGLTRSWKALFAVRLMLGLGIGPKSATVPIYASECAPKSLRGGLVMMWQMWTAFGIMLGYVFGLAFWSVGGNCRLDGKVGLPCSWNWRLMLVAPALPPLIPMLYVFTLPESPRFILKTVIRRRAEMGDSDFDPADLKDVARGIERAYNSLDRLNKTPLQATRELFLIYHSLKQESRLEGHEDHWLKTSLLELIRHPRSRHALYASVTVMFLQQFCGVNVLAYYSTTVIQNLLPENQRLTDRSPYLYSLGFGIINFVFALPAIPLMDLWGRRRLLLSTFPFLAVFQFVMAASSNTRSMVAAMYLFCVFYSAAEGPIPFVYSSESFPLHHRDMAMGLVTAVTWIFNFTLAVTWPLFLATFKQVGAFSWYGAWCVVGWFLVYFFVRETKGLGLEEMGGVFNPSTRVYASFAWEELRWFTSRPFISRHERSLRPSPPVLQDNPRYREWEGSRKRNPRDVEMQDFE